MKRLAALFCADDSVYFGFHSVDVYDSTRDALSYRDSLPVIAHPPCNLWCRLAKANFARYKKEKLRPGNDAGKFAFALEQVRRCGGVLEHPAGSLAWAEYNLSRPVRGSWQRSIDGGWVCEVWQSAYGHPANKKTWLYYVGKKPPFDLNWDTPTGKFQVGFYDKRGKLRNKPTVSKKIASATPYEFAKTLIDLALHCTAPPVEVRQGFVDDDDENPRGKSL